MANSKTVIEALSRIENIKTSIKNKLRDLEVKTTNGDSSEILIPTNANLELINKFIQSIEKREKEGNTYLITSAITFEKGYYPKGITVGIKGGSIEELISNALLILSSPDATLVGQNTYILEEDGKWSIIQGTVGSDSNKLSGISEESGKLVLSPEKNSGIKLKTNISYNTLAVDVTVDVVTSENETYITQNTIPSGYYPEGVGLNIKIDNKEGNKVINVLNTETPYTLTEKQSIISTDILEGNYDFIKKVPIIVQDAELKVESKVKGKISITALKEGWLSTKSVDTEGNKTTSLEIDASDLIDTLVDAQELDLTYSDFSEIEGKTKVSLENTYYSSVTLDPTNLINVMDNL